MKAFDRESLNQYKHIPRTSNTLYKDYYNPNSSPIAAIQQEQGFESLLEGIPQGMQETYTDLVENTLPSEFRNLSQNEILRKLEEAYMYNQPNTINSRKQEMDTRYNTIRNDLETQYQSVLNRENQAAMQAQQERQRQAQQNAAKSAAFDQYIRAAHAERNAYRNLKGASGDASQRLHAIYQQASQAASYAKVNASSYYSSSYLNSQHPGLD